ncbi:MAG: L,D-transpeptidase family protein, partial [Acidimicrobiia bacterium]
YLRHANGAGDADDEFGYGSSRMVPVAGRFGPLPGHDQPPPHLVSIPPLQLGDSGGAVLALQEALAEGAFYRGALDGDYGPGTAYAVRAFHQAAALPKGSNWQDGDWESLLGYRHGGFPNRPNEPDRIEVDLGRQVLFLIDDHQVEAVIPVSSGNGAVYYSAPSGRYVKARTPRGDFRFRRHIAGWRYNYLGALYRPWYFTTAYAIHGSNSVPNHPASHGCVRVPNWEADFLEGQLWIGMPVHVWD